MSENQYYRCISQIFSPTMFQKIVRKNDTLLYKKQALKIFSSSEETKNIEIISSLYNSMQNDYRCEYIYKNSLFLKLIRENSLRDTLILNEFKVASSKADLIMLNGSIRIFEIKTEFDDFSKLPKQISDYQKIADKVFVVTDESSCKKLYDTYKESNIGIMILNSKNNIELIKDAESDISKLDFNTIFRLLRKKEYLDIVYDNYNYIPDVPNTKIFRVCYNLLVKLDIIDFKNQVLQKLKERKLIKPYLLRSKKTPKELKYICNSLNFNENEYQKLYDFLKNSPCTFHI